MLSSAIHPRWVNAQNPVSWGQYVPYVVHQQYPFPPSELVNLAVAGGTHDAFTGITVVTLALLGFVWTWDQRAARLLAGVVTGGLLFAFGGFSMFQGVLYLLVPMIEKARNPAVAIVLVEFSLAIMASYGIDALRLRAAGRWCFAALLVAVLSPWPVHAVVA